MHFISAVVQVTGVIVHPDGQIISCALDKYATQTQNYMCTSVLLVIRRCACRSLHGCLHSQREFAAAVL